MHGRVLVVAGSDSGGGAGIQADVKTITALGAYAATSITALTVQNTVGVHAVWPVPADIVRAQMMCVLDDIGADVIKTGMLGDAARIDAVCDVVQARPRPPALVVDPVMVAKGGAALLAPDAVHRFRDRMLPLATLLTPNLPEAEELLGRPIVDERSMHAAARVFQAFDVPAVLLKGGHLPGADVTDLLITRDGIEAFTASRLPGYQTHGTGCTLASAIAAGLAQGLGLRDAVMRARAYVRAAIATAPGLGRGHGPLNHAVWAGSADCPQR